MLIRHYHIVQVQRRKRNLKRNQDNSLADGSDVLVHLGNQKYGIVFALSG